MGKLSGPAQAGEAYDFVGEYREGLAYVRSNLLEFRVGFIDEQGELVIPLDYFGRVTVDGRERFVHFPFFSEGLAALLNAEGKFGYIDRFNRTVIPFVYDAAWPFSDGIARVRLGEEEGCIDKQGTVVVPFMKPAD